MTPPDPATDGSMNNRQPRRYQVRRLTDSDHLTQAQVAERLDISQATVARDLKETVAPLGHTAKGTPFYPPGRFDRDDDFNARVAELETQQSLENRIARRVAAVEFAGPMRRVGRQGVPDELMTLEEFDQGRAK